MNPDYRKSYWKSIARIESLNKSLVTKILLDLERETIEEWKKVAEKTCSNLIKNFRKRVQQALYD